MTEPSSRYQVNLLDFLAFLIRWRKFLLTSVLLVSVVVGVISYLVTPRFASVAVIRSQESGGRGGIGSLIASKLGNLGGLAGFVAGGGETSGEVLISVLKSRWMSDRAIEAFDLRHVYKMEKASPEELVKAFLSRTDYDLDEKSTNVIVQVEDEDPKRAKAMAEYIIEELDKRNQELKNIAAKREREFSGQRLDAEKMRLQQLEDSLATFQLATGVLNIEEQMRATIQAYATLEATRLATQSELEIKSQILGPGNPESAYLRIKLSGIDSSKQALVTSKRSGTSDFLLSLSDVPSDGLTYLRLVRDIETQQLLVAYLLQQHEQAKVEELRNTPTIVRLDPPTEPTKRSWPRRSMMVAVAFAATFVLAVALASMLEMIANANHDPRHRHHESLRRVAEAWRSESKKETT